MKILIIDDQKDILEILKRILKNDAYELTTCESADDAISEFDKNSFDLIITDYFMPKRNGTSLVREFREKGFDKNVIFVSGFEQKELVQKALALRAFDYISKPFDRGEICEIVEDALDSKK